MKLLSFQLTVKEYPIYCAAKIKYRCVKGYFWWKKQVECDAVVTKWYKYNWTFKNGSYIDSRLSAQLDRELQTVLYNQKQRNLKLKVIVK